MLASVSTLGYFARTMVHPVQPMKLAPPRLEYVDALRGLAAVMVILFHVVQQYGRKLPSDVYQFFFQFERGVQLFYVVSAFALFGSLYARDSSPGESSSHGGQWRAFFVRRFFRIAPLFYLSTVFYLWLYGWGPRRWQGLESAITWPNVVSHFLFVNGFHPYWISSINPVEWSVAVEMLFYCTIPLLFRYVRTLKQSVVLTALSIVGSVALLSALQGYSPITNQTVWSKFLSLSIVSQFPVFMLGIVLFFVLRLELFHQKFRTWHAGILLVSVVALFLLGPRAGTWWMPHHVYAGGLFVLFALALAKAPVFLIVNPVTRALGTISFGLYLFHIVGMRISSIIFPDLGDLTPEVRVLSIFCVTMLISIAIATATYFCVEKPGQRVGSLIARRLEKAL